MSHGKALRATARKRLKVTYAVMCDKVVGQRQAHDGVAPAAGPQAQQLELQRRVRAARRNAAPLAGIGRSDLAGRGVNQRHLSVVA